MRKSTKLQIGVLLGGKSSEYAVSLISGREVVRHLDKAKYIPVPIVIHKSGARFVYVAPEVFSADLSVTDYTKALDAIFAGKISDDQDGIAKLRGVDVVFIAMHGSGGEDGKIQGFLESLGLPYTGPGVEASAIGMDKIIFRLLMKACGIRVPPYIEVESFAQAKHQLKKLGKPPYFVKPASQGSSVGASKVDHMSGLKKAVKYAQHFEDNVLIDKYVSGLELTVPVMGNTDPQALPVIEIHPLKADFFDYESKYTDKGSEEIVPARITPAQTGLVQRLAVEVYKAVGCTGFSRVDFIMHNATPYVLEINTIPGLTPQSLFPKSAAAAGLSYSHLLDKLIMLALER